MSSLSCSNASREYTCTRCMYVKRVCVHGDIKQKPVVSALALAVGQVCLCVRVFSLTVRSYPSELGLFTPCLGLSRSIGRRLLITRPSWQYVCLQSLSPRLKRSGWHEFSRLWIYVRYWFWKGFMEEFNQLGRYIRQCSLVYLDFLGV